MGNAEITLEGGLGPSALVPLGEIAVPGEAGLGFPLSQEAARTVVRAALGASAPALVRQEAGRGVAWLPEGGAVRDARELLERPCACMIGAFDGVHLGHRTLAAETLADARSRDAIAVAVTFDPDPMDLIAPGTPSSRLLPCAERIRMLASLGFDAVVAFPFDRHLRRTTCEGFCLEVLPSAMRLASIHVGTDFHMGSDRGGDVAEMRELGAGHGFDVFGEDLVGEDGSTISATRIRGLLRSGELGEANKLLGRCHVLRGAVERGRGEGTGMGFPTANVSFAIEDCMPKEGVYAGYVVVDGTAWASAINVGAPPTFSDARPAFLEANLIGYEGDLYGREVSVVFVRWLRASRRFDSLEELERTVEGNIAWTEGNLGARGVSLGL